MGPCLRTGSRALRSQRGSSAKSGWRRFTTVSGRRSTTSMYLGLITDGVVANKIVGPFHLGQPTLETGQCARSPGNGPQRPPGRRAANRPRSDRGWSTTARSRLDVNQVQLAGENMIDMSERNRLCAQCFSWPQRIRNPILKQQYWLDAEIDGLRGSKRPGGLHTTIYL